MEPPTGRGLAEHFASLEDPRAERTKLHPLLDTVTIALCVVISGAERWNDIEEFGLATEDFSADFFEVPGGVPSHDTFNRVFRALPENIRKCVGCIRSDRSVTVGHEGSDIWKALMGSAAVVDVGMWAGRLGGRAVHIPTSLPL